MRSIHDLAAYTTIAVGVLAGAAMLAAYALLETLRPKMVAFEPLTPGEEALVNYVGVGLLLALVFCVMALAGIARYSVKEQRVLPDPPARRRGRADDALLRLRRRSAARRHRQAI